MNKKIKNISELGIAPLPDLEAINKAMSNLRHESYCDYGVINQTEINKSLLIEIYNFEIDNYKADYCGACLNAAFDTPKLNISNFDGCPHYYGKIYYKNSIFEIKQKITEEFLEEGKETGGDWDGFKIGQYTQRFLSKESLKIAFELLEKEIVND